MSDVLIKLTGLPTPLVCDLPQAREFVLNDPDGERDLEVVWDKEEAERIAAAILRAAKVIPATSLN